MLVELAGLLRIHARGIHDFVELRSFVFTELQVGCKGCVSSLVRFFQAIENFHHSCEVEFPRDKFSIKRRLSQQENFAEVRSTNCCRPLLFEEKRLFSKESSRGQCCVNCCLIRRHHFDLSAHKEVHFGTEIAVLNDDVAFAEAERLQGCSKSSVNVIGRSRRRGTSL